MTYPTKISVPTMRLKYIGLFDFDGLYQLLVDWMKNRRYWFKETSYKHKVPSPFGAEQEIDFSGEKRVTEHLTHSITIAIHLYDLTEVDIEQHGIKKKLTNARMEINFDGTIELDYQGIWKGKKFLETLRDFYYKYIIRKDLENVYMDQLVYRIAKLQNTVKEFLDMQSKGNAYAGYLGDNK